MWNLIIIGAYQSPTKFWENNKKIKGNLMIIGIVSQIIKEGVNNNIFNKIINLIKLQKMWEKLHAVYVLVKVLYISSSEVFKLLLINKLKRFDKPVINILVDIYFLIKYLQLAIIPNQDI